jgi:hypothetical protein
MGESAQSRGWGAGWPNCQANTITSFAGGGVKINARREVGKLMAHLLDRTLASGYVIRAADTGGYSCRAIAKTKTPSNHSWGLAVDINWQSNPYGGAHHDIPDRVVSLWTSQMFRWGGHYRNTKDWMHFEFMGTPADAARLTAAIGGVNVGDPKALPYVLKQGTGMPPKAPDPWVMSVQQKLNRINRASKNGRPVLKEDGRMGKNTAEAVIDFKEDQDKLAQFLRRPLPFPVLNSEVGPFTLGAINFWAAQ